MSSAEVKALRSEVAVLREELARLNLEFSSFKRSVLEKESGESDGSFSVVSAVPIAGPRASESAASAGYLPAAVVGGLVASAQPVHTVPPSLTWEERLEISREVGRFLARAVASKHRGSSGRERIPLGSRFWLVAKDFHGNRLNPIRVFSRWGPAKDLCKRGSECGDAVFVGLPSQREIEAAVAASELRWDGQIEG